jgi:CheY-like chemotaxis protein
MEFICEDCQAVIHIPDERVPQNSTFRLTCPRCKRRIVGSTKTSESFGEGKTNVNLSSGPSEVTPRVSDHLDDDLPEAMDCLQPGQSAALLYVNPEESRSELRAMLEGMGYVVDIPASADHALQRLGLNHYRLILLDDNFEEQSPNPVASYLAALNMNNRREIFVVLIGQRFKTADQLQAFMESANLLIHPDDLPQLETFISRGLREHERFYKVFTECLIEAGKKL